MGLVAIVIFFGLRKTISVMARPSRTVSVGLSGREMTNTRTAPDASAAAWELNDAAKAAGAYGGTSVQHLPKVY